MVVIGDLNAQVGSSNENWETVMGTHGLGTLNHNSELFAELCGNHDLVIGGTLFRHSKLPECLLMMLMMMMMTFIAITIY